MATLTNAQQAVLDRMETGGEYTLASLGTNKKTIAALCEAGHLEGREDTDGEELFRLAEHSPHDDGVDSASQEATVPKPKTRIPPLLVEFDAVMTAEAATDPNKLLAWLRRLTLHIDQMNGHL